MARCLSVGRAPVQTLAHIWGQCWDTVLTWALLERKDLAPASVSCARSAGFPTGYSCLSRSVIRSCSESNHVASYSEASGPTSFALYFVKPCYCCPSSGYVLIYHSSYIHTQELRWIVIRTGNSIVRDLVICREARWSSVGCCG